MDRRKLLQGAGAIAAVAASGEFTMAHGEAGPDKDRKRGMAHGLTVLNVRRNGGLELAVKTDKGILMAREAAKSLKMHAPATIDELLQQEDGPSLNALADAALKSSAAHSAFIKEEGIDYGPVVVHPEKIVCVGLNYRKHAQEIGAPIPKAPVLFSKFNVSLNHHNGVIKLPVDVAKKFDYECELVMVMGKEARNVSEADALSYVAGYCTGNDFTARDLQLETGGQWLIGKTPDQFAPLGPYMVTADQINPDSLKLETRVNGETRQSSNTSDFIFNSKQMISYISRYITLRPGDIIFTGTPEGVIQGKPKDQQVWLKPGDKIACSLEKLGELTFDLV
ncbi:MAG TPA: fumarylacetoacetate hydrolase family protein [Candidatus Angelobacter sp.]|jgi:2-keto-4-pentenoate hydratase/2-oxohepta-3-ene-1,7-dioic acid hydratase in catechol pathway